MRRKFAGPVARVFVIKRRVALGNRLERVVKIHHDFGERHLVFQDHPRGRQIAHVKNWPRRSWHSCMTGPDELRRHHHRGQNVGFFDLFNVAVGRKFGGAVILRVFPFCVVTR
jgi:hypothetical protein